ncbi:SHOCT domain-containing protein [Chloroflexota bacterium]
MPFRLGPWELIIILVILVAWFVPIFLCVWLAKKKGKDTIVWAIIALFLGIIALLILAILPAEDQKGRANTNTVATLKGLEELRASGTLTEEEFQAQKKKLLSE